MKDGTYNASTLAPLEYTGGYQVSYEQTGDNYTETERAAIEREFSRASTDGVKALGVYGGTAEASYNVASKAEALRLAAKYNQYSIWDWAAGSELVAGGTGSRM